MANETSHWCSWRWSNEETTFPLRCWELLWYSLILVTGTLGNLLVCLVICKSSSVFRSTRFNMYICSLAVADMLRALVVLPNYILSTSTFHHPNGFLGDMMCKTITGHFLTSYVTDVSAYGLVLIALERLRAVKKFQTTLNSARKRKWRVWLSIFATWIIPLAVNLPLVVLLRYRRGRTPLTGDHCTFSWGEPTLGARIYTCVTLIFDCLIPILIFVYSFCYIRKCLVGKEKRVSKRMQQDSFNDGYRYRICLQKIKRRQKTVKVLMITSAVYVVCWIPNKIMLAMISYVDQGDKPSKFTWNSPVYQIGLLLGFTGSCINPYLYAWQSKEFREHSKRALRGLLPKSLGNDNGKQIEGLNPRHETSFISKSEATARAKTESQTYSTVEDPTSHKKSSRTDRRTPIVNPTFQVEYGIRNQLPAKYQTII